MPPLVPFQLEVLNLLLDMLVATNILSKASKTPSVPDPLWFKDQSLAIRMASCQS